MADEEIEKNEIMKVADLMKKEVAKLDNYETRQEVVSFLKDQFIAQRMEASSAQEQARVKILDKIVARIEDDGIPFQQLLKAYEIINKGADADLAGLLGGSAKGGVNLQINNSNAQAPENAPKALQSDNIHGNPMKDMGQVIESIKVISSGADPEALKNLRKTLDD